MAIQHRRGNYADFDPTKMVAGEPAVVLGGDPTSSDGKAAYIAFGPGSVKKLATAEDMRDEIYNQTQNIIHEVEEGVADDVEQAESAAQRAETAAAQFEIDATLTQQGKPADAKKVGDEISDLKADLSDLEKDVRAIVPGLTEEAKTALLDCFTHVAWVDSNGTTYFNALRTALGRTILYSWDFTKSLTDEIQGLTVSLVGLTNPPTQGNTGIVFNDIGQAITLLSDDFTYADFIKGKTVQIDVAEFNPQSTVTARTMRFLTMKDSTAATETLFKTGLCYFEDNTPDPRWCLVTYQEGASVSYVPDEVSFMSAKEDISGHTIGVYFDTSGRIKVYRDGILKGTSNNAIPDAGQYGLQLGYAGEERYGGRFYNARVTGLRIYDGDIA